MNIISEMIQKFSFKSNLTAHVLNVIVRSGSTSQKPGRPPKWPLRYKINTKHHMKRYAQWPVDEITGEKKYTTEPVDFFKTGGRAADGSRENFRRGGGDKVKHRLIDTKREAKEDGSKLTERVLSIDKDRYFRTAHIALLGRDEHKRWIIAADNVKEGDLIHTYSEIPRMPVKPIDGDSHPVAALPIGTLIHNVEIFKGQGGNKARAAGTCCVLLRKTGDKCILKMPSKREIAIDNECMVTVGRVSNIDHDKVKFENFWEKRALGIRPRSGWWHRKQGYHGRKIRPIRPMIKYDKPPIGNADVFNM